MSNQSASNEKATTLNNALTTMTKNWHTLRLVGQTWNLKAASQAVDKIDPLVSELPALWQDAKDELEVQINLIRREIESPVYAETLERELKASGVPISGTFPSYMMPPFKLSISIDSLEARLSMGRKNEKTAELSPARLAQWVAIRYKKVTSRRFNANAFLKDLLEAYHIANRLNFRESVPIYGRAVPLMELYDILTLKSGARQEYPSQFFVFDLGLLKESGVMKTDQFSYELGFAKDQKRAIVVVDSSGREDRVSSLAIHKIEGGR